MEDKNVKAHTSVDKSKEDVLKGVGEPSETLPISENEENKNNEESEEIKCNEGKRKRGRPFEKDKEGLPVTKMVKSPRKKKNLKIMANNNNGKSNGYNKFFKRDVSTEKCVFCQE